MLCGEVVGDECKVVFGCEVFELLLLWCLCECVVVVDEGLGVGWCIGLFWCCV